MLCAGLVEETTDPVLDFRPLIQPDAAAGPPNPSDSTLGVGNSRKKAVSSSRSPRTRKKPAPVIGKVNLKLASLNGISKRASSSRPKSPALAASTGPRPSRRAVSSGAHSCAVDDEEALLIFLKASESDEANHRAGVNDR